MTTPIGTQSLVTPQWVIDKLGEASLTASKAAVSDANGKIVSSAVSSTELGYIAGVTSAIQDQLDAKEDTITNLPVSQGGTNSTTALNNDRIIVSSGDAIVEGAAITGERALVSNISGIPVASDITATELNSLNNISGNVQDQLDGKVDLSGDSFDDGADFAFGTGSGSKFGTAANQKIGFYNATPVVQQTTGAAEAAFVENAGGTAVNTDSTFGGYTMQQVVQCLQNLGFLA